MVMTTRQMVRLCRDLTTSGLFASMIGSLLLILLPPPLQAQHLVPQFEEQVRVCPADHAQPDTLPDFTGDACYESSVFEVDPQGQMIWVKARYIIPQPILNSNYPLGLFVSGKVSTRIFIAGERIGDNGQPGLTRGQERPGQIDGVIFIPSHHLQVGSNTIVFQMSSHHGFVTLNRPIHRLNLRPYDDPKASILAFYSGSFVLLGLFFLAALYFAGTALLGWQQSTSWTFSALSSLAFCQLLLETSRGLFGYAYPFHDWRLVGILGLAFAFSMTLLGSLTFRFLAPNQPRLRLAFIALPGLLALIAMGWMKGFDGKTVLALIIPAGCAAVLATYRALKGDRHAALIAVGLSLFTLTGFLTQGGFLDSYLYFFFALMVALLLFDHARALSRERRLRQHEQARAHRLELALELAQERETPSFIDLNTGGDLNRVPTDRISHISAAGDYVEVYLAEGRRLMHKSTLNKMAAQLPTHFIKIHRSHLVNSSYISHLTRLDTGQGQLTLNKGQALPVSRRILPQVRQALREQDEV